MSKFSRFAAACAAVVCAFGVGVARADEPVGVELVTNGSFEDGNTKTGWSFAIYPGEGVQKYENNDTWVNPSLLKLDGAGAYCAMLQSKNLSQCDTMTQAVTLPANGLYAFSCAYAARTTANNGTFWGGTTSVVLDNGTDAPLSVADFTTTKRHRIHEDRLSTVVSVLKSGSYNLRFQTTYAGDRGNIIDLVSLKLALPFEAGYCAVGGQFPGQTEAYETFRPSVGTVLTTNALIVLSRTTCAKLVGYKLYRYTAENGYSPAEPETVAATSYTVTAEDLATPFRLVWQWEVVDRVETLDTSLFSRCCELTLAGYSGTETLKHFPLLVRLAPDTPAGFAYGNTGVNGCDLRFTDAEGHVIPHEIDTWNPSGESTVWVRVPSVSGQNTKIRLYYGVEDADLASLPENVPSDVWSDHLGVWHMNIDPTDKSTRDSTVGGMHGTMTNGQDCDPASQGMIGGAFTNSSSAYLTEDMSAPLKRSGGPYVFSAWTYNYNGANFAAIWSAKASYSLFEIIFEGSPTTLTTRPSGVAHTVPTFSKTWRHLQVVYKDNQALVYMDGELVSTHDNSAAPDFFSISGWYVGQRAGSANCAWKGSLDELRVREDNFSSDWIKAEYESQKSGATFVAYGEVQKTKVAALTIADRGLAVNGTLATLSAFVIPEEGKSAVCRVVYGTTEAMPEVTATTTHDGEAEVSRTLSLDWATAYCAQWQAWTVGKPEEVKTTEMCRFTTDGTPQIAADLGWSLAGNVVTVSDEVTALRGAGTVTVALYRAKAGADEELMEQRNVGEAGTVRFADETLDWGADYSYRAVFVSTKEGTGAWTNETRVAVVRVPSKPVKFRASAFAAHSEITLSGYRGSEQLRDIPVLVRLSAGHPEKFDAAQCGPNGAYIRFTDELGGLIPHEVDTWNASGESLVWVRVPILKGTGTKITLHMAPNNVARLPAVDSRQVWSEYLGVWHMDVADDWSVRESGAYELHGSVWDGYPSSFDPTVVPTDPSKYSFAGGAGIVGGSHTNSGWAYVRVPANEAFTNLTSHVTFSAWVQSAANQASFAAIWNNKASGTSYLAVNGTEITLNGANALDVRGAGSSCKTISVPSITPGAWHLVTVAYDGDTFAAYVDDNDGRRPLPTEKITPLAFSATDALAMGQRVGWVNQGAPSTSCNWYGNLDEMRIGRKTESDDWVRACYDTVMDADFAAPARVSHTGGLVIFFQ